MNLKETGYGFYYIGEGMKFHIFKDGEKYKTWESLCLRWPQGTGPLYKADDIEICKQCLRNWVN
uniref:Uncharacterized protein n=1 Tax=viral metagenome TaxID=1070528 RepID=A0A6M3Y7U7_9ZZZZ